MSATYSSTSCKRFTESTTVNAGNAVLESGFENDFCIVIQSRAVAAFGYIRSVISYWKRRGFTYEAYRSPDRVAL
jgi:hypothetical protein